MMKPAFSWIIFFLQSVMAPFGALIFGLVAGEAVHAILGGKQQFTIWLCYAVVGFVQGFFTQSVIPRAKPSGGCFVWVTPMLILLVALYDEIQHFPSKAFTTFFIWNPYALDGLPSVVITFPAFASLAYSSGIGVASRLPPDKCWWGTRDRTHT